MIIGHGIDIVNLKRFTSMNDQRLEKIALRICTESELEEFNKSNIKNQYLAKIWAGKEAIAKSFREGIRNTVTWKNIKIQSDHKGCPIVYFNEKLAGPTCHISFSHDGDILIASAILEVNV